MTLIRRAQHQDLPVLLEFEQQIVATERPMDPTLIQDQPISYYPIAEYLDAEHTEVLVAEANGRLVGSVYGQIRERKPFFQTTHLGYIGFMYVDPDQRGQGLVDALIDGIKAWFTEQGITEIILHVYAQNPRAIRAYEKAGFVEHLIEMRLDPNNGARS